MEGEGVSSRTGAVSTKIRWMLGAFVAMGALAVFFWTRLETEFGEEGYAYGFSGDVYRFSEVEHEIVFGEGVSRTQLVSLGDYLEQIGYFSPAYGGVIQIRSRNGGFDVYLTYPRKYWDRPDFRDEVISIRDDLETNVFLVPTRIVLVDEDEEGIHSMILNHSSDAS